MAHFNPGYDIESEGQGRTRLIEVKGLSGDWSAGNPVRLTPAEFERAQAKGERYWLCVVEYATSEPPIPYLIQDPPRRVHRYGLDHGWRQASEGNERQLSDAAQTKLAQGIAAS